MELTKADRLIRAEQVLTDQMRSIMAMTDRTKDFHEINVQTIRGEMQLLISKMQQATSNIHTELYIMEQQGNVQRTNPTRRRRRTNRYE